MALLDNPSSGLAVHIQFPPSPPSTAKASRDGSTHGDSEPVELSGIGSPTDTSSAQKPYPLPPASRPKSILPEDLKTPDKHVERDPRLIRLTGVHPFNVEPPLSDLYNEGFLTSQDLHYVRNHGPVPECADEDMPDWRFTVEGLVEKPIAITVRELLTDYDQITCPVTLVCAGNRRKEQNMLRKSKGFSWGAAGLSTALWTGVPIGELLARACPRRGAKYVCFEGADKLPNGYYGTSVKLNWCMDPNRGIMIAHMMNGEKLHPDHGKPVRVVVPGQIGGRSVKWLKRIIVTAGPSNNWYHIYDNRVLPTTVTPDKSADLPDVWKDERYAIYDLNSNSVICYPAHEETVALGNKGGSYQVRGYAYGGGGKRITRVEVTLDRGKSWLLANMRYPEDDYRLAPDGDTLFGGKIDMWWRETSFCWCFWELDVGLDILADADDIMVRAMDEGMMVQPRDMYWSVLGMMNNPWFRVVVHKEAHSLRFEHPTQPALMPGGWMERIKKAGGDLSNGFWGERIAGNDSPQALPEPENEICMTNSKVKRTITLDELRKHETETEPWFVVNGEVYDGTPFLEGHPGGAASIVGASAQDATEEFVTIHSENAKAMMPEYHIGTLDEASQKALADSGEAEKQPDPSRAVFLQSKAWTKALLETKTKVSPDSFIFTFKLDHADQSIGLPTGQHLMMRLRDPVTREAIIRPYTPLSESWEKGYLRILIKVYYDTPGRKGGKMTQALAAIPPGHFVEFKGPVGKFEYLGRGRCTVSGQSRRIRRFVMVCGGSGITPIFQVLGAVLNDPDDPTECLVLDGNRDEHDILCRADLDYLATVNEKRCNLIYTLTKPGPEWKGATGRLDEAFLNEKVGPPPPTNDQEDVVLVCGPESMEKSVKSIFGKLGWKDSQLVFF
ncbi:nitrate reductase (NAD(P)H) [Geosmithia morbida]|uniref:Nitrate reductase n=1 Tax=Geosmithia morbida TaxID=1094350 RepID=A0A9P4Z272_9HYPO|nr:nitrate reductase (NAD(P)H) [Geosmithia morbida]KAF4125294.1 nitrate reductase (NAD(P)H) [Geosmithia morbida]